MACFLLWMFNKSWCFLLWGKLSHQTFFGHLRNIFLTSDLVYQQNDLSEIGGFFCLLLLLAFHWNLLSIWQLIHLDHTVCMQNLNGTILGQLPHFFAILGAIMRNSLVVRWAKVLFSKFVLSVYFTWFMADARDFGLWNRSWNLKCNSTFKIKKDMF